MKNITYHPLLMQQKKVPYILILAILTICFFVVLILEKHINTSRSMLILSMAIGICSIGFISFVLFQSWKGMKLLSSLERQGKISEEKYQYIINNVASVVFTIDLPGNFTFISKRSLQLTGYTSEELDGKHFTSILDPQWKERVFENYYSQYLHLIGETIYEFPIVNKNGYKKWVEQCAVLIMENGKPIGFHCIVRDISDKKQIQFELEETEKNLKHQQFQLQSVLDNTTSIIFIKDLQGKYTVANQRFMDLLQVQKNQVIGFTDYNLTSKDQADYFSSLDAKVISERKPIEVEQIIEGPNGPVNLLLVKFPLFDQNNNVFGISGIATDISERTQYQKELISARQLAENAKLLQEQFLANMSHEIRTPMNGIQGMTNLLLESSLNSVQEKYATIIKRSVNNLLVIINDILDFSKIQAGKLSIEEIAFDMRESLDAIRPLFAHRLEKKHLDFELNMDNKVPNFLIGDPYRLNQVLVNLVGNAIKFTEKGKIVLSVSMKNETGNSGVLRFSVKDSGIGIEEDKLKLVFESFSQASVDVARKYGGTGLGLTISKQLVELQNGNIWVTSKYGEGSEFIFELPYRFAAENDVTGMCRLNDLDFSKLLLGKKVLVAEDNSVNQFLIDHVLNSVGIFPTIVNNGQEAIEKLKKGKSFDVILMDLQMPILDGYKTTDFIRTELKNDTPIVAMTATAMKGEFEKCLEVGFTDYMSKPFEFVDLYKKLCTVLNIKIVETVADDSEIIVTDNNTKINEIKPYNLSYFEKILKKKDLVELLKPLFESLNTEIHLIVDSIENNDWITVAKMAHKLKSSVGYIKANDLLMILQKIETNATMVEKRALLHSDVENLKRLADEVKRHLALEIKALINELAVAC
ncbi:MAG: ATP-binding protein [Bacteroidetes bacterium]|nr:ATP-binding protein [Bacteroidota bacterium]